MSTPGKPSRASRVRRRVPEMKTSRVTFSLSVMVLEFEARERRGGDNSACGGGALVAVDTWLGALEFWTRTESAGAVDPTRNLLPHHGYPQVYYQFLANVAQRGLSECSHHRRARYHPSSCNRCRPLRTRGSATSPSQW